MICVFSYRPLPTPLCLFPYSWFVYFQDGPCWPVTWTFEPYSALPHTFRTMPSMPSRGQTALPAYNNTTHFTLLPSSCMCVARYTPFYYYCIIIHYCTTIPPVRFAFFFGFYAMPHYSLVVLPAFVQPSICTVYCPHIQAYKPVPY